MISLSRVLRLGALAAVLAAAASSFAVIATFTDSTPEDAAYAYVGKFNGKYSVNGQTVVGLLGGGVVVGPHQILTARHVVNGGNFNDPDTTFVLNGVTYHPTAVATPPNYTLPGGGTTKVDIALITVAETFTDHYLVTGATSVGSTVTMVGFGQGGGVSTSASTAGSGSTASSPAGTFYAATGSGARRKGDNTLDDVNLPLGGDIGPSLTSYLDAAGEATLGDRDSGGGWFQNGRLIGISSFVSNDTQPVLGALPKYRAFGFVSANVSGYDSSETPGYTGPAYSIGAGESYFSSGAVDLTNPEVNKWLRGQGVVPEPASVIALGLGAAALLRRRKKA